MPLMLRTEDRPPAWVMIYGVDGVSMKNNSPAQPFLDAPRQHVVHVARVPHAAGESIDLMLHLLKCSTPSSNLAKHNAPGCAPGVHGEHQAEAGVRAQHARAAARRAGLVQQQLAARLQQRVQPVQHLRGRGFRVLGGFFFFKDQPFSS